MKLLFVFMLMLMNSIAFGASHTIAQCAVNQVKASHGARINLLRSDLGEIKANFIQGTTVSGTAYHLKETSAGVYVGSIKNKPQFTMKLKISKTGRANQYINGFTSTLEVIYPDLNSATGISKLNTTSSDDFVCGKKVSNF